MLVLGVPEANQSGISLHVDISQKTQLKICEYFGDDEVARVHSAECRCVDALIAQCHDDIEDVICATDHVAHGGGPQEFLGQSCLLGGASKE